MIYVIYVRALMLIDILKDPSLDVSAHSNGSSFVN